MRKVLFAGLFALLALPMGAHGDSDAVMSEKLTISDVEGHLKRDNWLALVEVHGIHQEGGTATVYYKGKEPVPPFVSKEGFNVTEATLSLVRFNSGKWFVPRDGTFLKK